MAETIRMPKLGFDMAEGMLVRWVKTEGEAIQKGEVLAEIETDKATVEVEASVSGVVYRHLVEKGTSVPVGQPIAIIAAPGEQVDVAALEGNAPAPAAPAVETKAAAPVQAVMGTAQEAAGTVRASPLAKRIAQEKGLDLRQVRGSGPGGRVVRRDVENAVVSPTVAGVAPAVAVVTPAAAAPGDERVPLDRLRAIIGRRMSDSKQQVPHFYVTHEYDMAALMALRRQANELLPETDKLSVNDFIVKAVALALRRYPGLNASLGQNELIRHGRVNVGVAVALESGLITVVCKDADQKPVRQISAEVREMVARARQGKVRPEDIEGSTFSISNLGMYDVEHFVAIINPPEAAILAVGSVKQAPVVVDGALAVGTRMRATLSADHRVTDGAEAAQFLQALAEYLEKPLVLLL